MQEERDFFGSGREPILWRHTHERVQSATVARNSIVLSEHYNRENNEVVEFPVPHQSITAFMLLRKSVCLMRSKFGRRRSRGSELDTDRGR